MNYIFIPLALLLTYQSLPQVRSKEWSFLSEEPEYTLEYYQSLEPSDTFEIIYDLMKRVLSKTVQGDQSNLVNDFQLELIANEPNNQELKYNHIPFKLKNKNHPFWKLGYNLDVMEVDNNGTSVVLRGSSTIALATAFNWYLRDYCNSTYDWRTYTVNIPNNLPIPNYQRKVRSVPYSYYENVCTVSYTQAFWTWDEWETHLDWMAMEGINLPLAFTGQEYIFAKTFNEYNFTTSDLQSFFSGTGFFAWQRMGNIQGSWAKIDSNSNPIPIPESAILDQYNLQIKILSRMYSFGMIPALTAFAGHVPTSIINIYPNASVTPSPNWGGFPNEFCCVTLLNFSDPLFEKIGITFMEQQIKYYGESHVYQCDSFNEMDPPSNNSNYLKSATEIIYNAMNQVDENAVWLMQGWLFVSSGFWTNEAISAYLSGINNDAMIILDLYSEVDPQYERTDSYFGKPFIWNTLHNFGGNDGIRGTFEPIAKGVPDALNMTDTTIVGVGITMEGIWQNWIVYDLTLDMAWHKNEVNLESWINDYSQRIYGLPSIINNKNNINTIVESSKKMWKLLKNTVYNITTFGGVTKSIIVRRPSLDEVYSGFMGTTLLYNPLDIQTAWKYIISISNDTGLKQVPKFNYDLIDITRQALSDQYFIFYNNLTKIYNNGNGLNATDVTKLQSYMTQMIDVIDDLEIILNTNVLWMVGPWIKMSQEHDSENNNVTLQHWWEFEARNQITLWGNSGEISDYASKQWGGLVSTYYKKRWNYFFDILLDNFKNQVKFNDTKFGIDIFNQIEEPWQTNFSLIFPTTPTGDTVKIACDLYKKWNWFGESTCNYV